MCLRAPSKTLAYPWFTKEVKQALRAVRRARKLHLKATSAHRALRGNVPARFDTLRLLDRARGKLRRIIKKAKKDWAYDFASKMETKRIWSLNSWHKGIRKYRTPPLQGPDGTTAISSEEKATLFRASFFPPPPEVPTEVFDLSSLLPHTRPFELITRTEVENLLRHTSNRSVPGWSGISYKAIKWAMIYAGDYIIGLFNYCLLRGFHHPDWKTAVTVVIPKPNKPDYSNPRAYRPVQLLECLGKLLEKVVANLRLMFECSSLGLIPPEQFGGVSSASCLGAGLVLTHDLQEAKKRKKAASLLTVDVKGFFDSINHNCLLFVLHQMGFPAPITTWVRSFLSDRASSISCDGFTGDMLPISVGVYQGSPISPILSIIFSAPVLHALKEQLNLLTESLIITQSLLRDAGMSLDSSKSELMHFSSYNPAHYIITTSPEGEEIIIRPAKKFLRWLGIFFDPFLTFSHHITIMRNRGMTAVNGLRMLSNTVRGLGQRHLRIMVKMVVVTILTYASVVWYNPSHRQKGLIGSLQAVMNQATRLISGCFRTAPTHAKQVLSHQPPIDLTLQKLSTSAANCLLRLPFTALLS